MRKRLLIVLAVLAVAALATALILPAPRYVLIGWIRGESFYQGLPTSYWGRAIQQYNSNQWPAGGLAPAGPTSWWDRLVGVLGFSSPGRPPDPPLAALFWGQEPDPAMMPVLIELLAHPDDQVRYHARNTLSAFGPEARVAVPALIKMLKDPNIYDRRNVAVGLAAIGAEAEDALPDLIDALKEEDDFVLHYTISVLGELGPKAREAIPALNQLLESGRAELLFLDNSKWKIGDTARQALKQIDPQASQEGMP